jgi:hypothetical protein
MADSFPTFGTDDDIVEFYPDDDLDQDTEVQPPKPYGISWSFDFVNLDLFFGAGGKPYKVSELEVLKEWIMHSLMIQRGESPIFSTEIGTDIHTYIGSKDTNYVMARVKQEIINALLQHDRIQAVDVTEIFSLLGEVYALIQFQTVGQEEGSLTVTLS